MNNYDNTNLDLKKFHELVEGSIDYIEAGDCRFPGKPHALRAIATGDAQKPIALFEAQSVPKLSEMKALTIEEAVSKLRERQGELTLDVGAAAKIFTVKLRKHFR
jgi:hypothetical protein